MVAEIRALSLESETNCKWPISLKTSFFKALEKSGSGACGLLPRTCDTYQKTPNVQNYKSHQKPKQVLDLKIDRNKHVDVERYR